jgi:prophage regulatory protein
MVRYIRRKQLIIITGLSATTLWRLEKNGKFPKRRKLSDHLVGWLENEINEWLASREII